MDKETTLILGGVVVVLFLGSLYFMEKAQAAAAAGNDVSLSQIATLAATVAAYW